MKRITVGNKKGGGGKTNVTFHLGGALAKARQRVLLVDADPQGNLTQAMLGFAAFKDIDPARTLAAIIAGMPADPSLLVRDFASPGKSRPAMPGLYLLPASATIEQHNHVVNPAERNDSELRMARWLMRQAPEYDFVLIDTPPSLQFLTWTAMIASQYVLTPVVPEELPVNGLPFTRQFIDQVNAAVPMSPPLSWLGVLRTKVQKQLATHQMWTGRLLERCPAQLQVQVLETVVPERTAYKEAIDARTPLSFGKKCAEAKVIDELAEEIARATGIALNDKKVA